MRARHAGLVTVKKPRPAARRGTEGHGLPAVASGHRRARLSGHAPRAPRAVRTRR
jgi:hypothetical protein